MLEAVLFWEHRQGSTHLRGQHRLNSSATWPAVVRPAVPISSKHLGKVAGLFVEAESRPSTPEPVGERPTVSIAFFYKSLNPEHRCIHLQLTHGRHWLREGGVDLRCWKTGGGG